MVKFIKTLPKNIGNIIQTTIWSWVKTSFRFVINLFKRKCLNSDVEYVTLNPNDKIENGKEYLKALKWAIDGKNATNIALSGPYGSGKSSVIETFLRNNHNFKEKSIKISMATFTEKTVDDKGNPAVKKVTIEKEEIEKSILKQLFYKVKHKKIPQSRYRKLHRVGFWSVFFSNILLTLSSLLVVYVFWPSALKFVANKIIIAGDTINFPGWCSLILAVSFILMCLAAASNLYRTILSKIRVKEIKVAKEVSFKRSTENQDTIFNKNMDEIVYFFEETKYRIVFFEDFDRLNNTEIFIHLRELNLILNNYEAIKEPIVFVYAIKDDLFVDEERTKFFDFIIPIVPIVNSTNSGEILLEKLSNSKELKKEHKISESFVMDVSPYISDMRILQNIYNEFVLYKTTLKIGQNLTLLDEPMLALIIFKNLYPQEFADLQMETGVVKQAFKDKLNFVFEKRTALQERINDSTKILENIHKEIFSTVKQLKYAFLCEITNNIGIAKEFTPSGLSKISASEFLTDGYVIPDWSNISSCSISYINLNGNGTYSTSCSSFNNIYDRLINSYKTVSLLESEKIDEEKISIDIMKQEIHKISSKTLVELLEEYSIDDILSKEVTANDFLVFLLRRGYIDENYVEYINYFKATSITTEDKNYILGIKNLSPKPYNYKLTRTAQVIERLQPYEFEEEAIYNFDLLEYLLSTDKYDDKLNLYIKQLSNGSENSWKFIDEFIHITKYEQRFISELSNTWHQMWDSIFNNQVLSLDRKFYYLSLIISYSSIKSIKAMNDNGNFVAFFVSNKDVLQRLSSIEEAKIIDVISSLNIKFTDFLIENISASVLDYIFDNNCYIINFEMIQHIVEYKDKELVPYLKEKNYSTLFKLNYNPLLKYIEYNIDKYTDEIILLGSNTEEDLEAIIKLLELNANGECRHIQIIENENFYVEDITSVCANIYSEHKEYVLSIWDTIIANRKLKPSWHNFKNYWHYYGHTSKSITYICENIDELIKDDSSCIDNNSFIKELITSDIDCESLSKLLPKLPWKEFNIKLNTLDKDKVSMMVAQKYFIFDVDRYNELLEDFPDLCTEFIIQNQSEYMDINEEIDMDSELLESLIFDERFCRSNATILINNYGAEHMTNRIAQNLDSLKVKINLEVFEAVWILLDFKKKENLMLQNLEILDADKFENCFSELNYPYKLFAQRKTRHEVDLKKTEANLLLAHRLEKVDYITSFKYKTRKNFEPATGQTQYYEVISCKVKAIY